MVPRVSAGVLRVIVYKKDENKIEVDNKEGLNIITKALKRNKDKETRQHLTGQYYLEVSLSIKCHST